MKKLFCLLLLLPFFRVTACAQLDTAALYETLPEDVREISGALPDAAVYDGEGAFRRLLEAGSARLRETVMDSRSTALGLLALLFLGALAVPFCQRTGMSELTELCLTAGTALFLTQGLDSLLAQAVSAIAQLLDYSRAAMPCLFAAAAVSSAAASSAARYAAVSLAMDVMMTLAQKLILPLIHAQLALSIALGLYDNALLQSMLGLFRQASTLTMTLLATLFIAFIGISGLVSGTADAAAVRTAKTVIATALPVVGGIMSDAAMAVLSSAALLRNAAGVFSLIAVAALCLAPFAALFVRWVLFRFSVTMAGIIPGKRLGVLLGGFGSAMGQLMGLIGSFSMILFFSIVSAIRTAAP